MHIGSTAAKVPVKFQSDRSILKTNLTASRLCKILWSDDKTKVKPGGKTKRLIGYWNRARCANKTEATPSEENGNQSAVSRAQYN